MNQIPFQAFINHGRDSLEESEAGERREERAWLTKSHNQKIQWKNLINLLENRRNSVQVYLIIFISLLEQTLKAIPGFSWDCFKIKPLSSLIFKLIPPQKVLWLRRWREHTQTHTPPKWVGPLPDSHFDGIISLITHDAKGYINVQKTPQSVNHQTDTETLITTTHPAPCTSRGRMISTPALHKTHTKAQFYALQQRSMLLLVIRVNHNSLTSLRKEGTTSEE